jgi:murein DD-endopeptidase MepM/ murein hydrolase activator NlpD
MPNQNKIKSNSYKKIRTPATDWLRNVSKSFGYSTMDIMSDITPNTFNTISANKDFTSNLITQVKSLRRNTGAFGKLLKGENAQEYLSIGKEALENAKADLKSGNLYNKERTMQHLTGGGFDDLDFNMDDDSDSNSTSTDDVEITTRNNPITNSINTQSEIMIHTTNAIMEQNKDLSIASISVNREVGNMLYDGMGQMNENIKSLVMFHSENTSKYISASMQYYGDVISRLDKLIELNSKNSTSQQDTSNNDKYKRSNFEDIFFMGQPNMQNYVNMVKRNVKNYAANNLILSQVGNILSDKDSLRDLAQQPLMFISNALVKSLIPNFLREVLTEFDKSVGSFFPALTMKLENLKNSENPFLQMISKIFGINDRQKTSVDTSVYNKDSMPFNGMAQKSLVEVIPGLLSRILSSINGKKDLVYDYKNGKFVSYEDEKRREKSDIDNTMLSKYSYLPEVKNRLDAYEFTNNKDREKILDKIDKLFIEVTRHDGLVNPHKRIKKDGTVKDDIKELLQRADGSTTSSDVELIRSLILSLDKNQIMKMFGNDVYEARGARTKYFIDQEENKNGSYKSYLYNDLYKDVKVDKRGRITNDSPFFSKDKYGLTQSDYLHKIYRTLIEGVSVVVSDSGISGNRKSDLSKFRREDRDETTRKLNDLKHREVSATEKERLSSRGVTILDSVYDIDNDTDVNISRIKNYMELNKELVDKKPSLLQKLMPENINDLLHKITLTPANIVKKFFVAIDNGMYKAVFGDPNGNKKSFINEFFNKMEVKIKSAFDFISEKVFIPIKEALIGKDGLLTKIKNSEMFKKVKKGLDYLFGIKNEEGKRENGLFSDVYNEFREGFSQAKYFMAGKDNPDSVVNSFRSMVKEFNGTMKEYLFGDKNIKAKDVLKSAKGKFGSITGMLREGLDTFHTALFGDKEKLDFTELNKAIKEKAPKAVATGLTGAGAGLLLGGNLGIIGSIFLPGGPIGGALIGMATGLLSQSNKFKDWLFGKMDDATNTRIGGIISQNTQEFFKKYKVPIVGGASLGLIKTLLFGTGAIGFLPATLIGGPLTGMIMGAGAAVFTQTEKFKSMMFGDKDGDGNRSGGVMGKLFGRVKDMDSKKAGSALVGALGGGVLGTLLFKFGIGAKALSGITSVMSTIGISGAFTSQFGTVGTLIFGPILGASLGIAAGLIANNKDLSKSLFGIRKTDKEGNEYREGGLLGRIENFMKVQVLQPFKFKLMKIKFNISDWFDEKIAERFLSSLDPVKEEIKRFGQRLKGVFDNIKETIQNSFIYKTAHAGLEKIVNGFYKYVFKPFRTALSKVVDVTLGLTGKIAEFPFKILNGLANMLFNKHRREGIRNVRKMIVRNIKDNIANSELGKDLSKYIIEPVKNGIDTIVTFAKDRVNDLYKFTKKIIGGIFKLGFKAIFGVVKLPFTLYAGGKKVVKRIKNYFHDPSIRDQQRQDDIKSGNRSILQSIGDLLGTFNPFSNVRHDAMYGEYGAHYEEERYSGQSERAKKRAERKKRHNEILTDMRNKVNANQQLASSLGYNITEENAEDAKGIYKDINKQMKDKYGKNWSKIDDMQKDSIKNNLSVTNNTNIIKDNTSKLIELVAGIKNKIVDNAPVSAPEGSSLPNNPLSTPNLPSIPSIKNENTEDAVSASGLTNLLATSSQDGLMTTATVTTEKKGESTVISSDEPNTYENILAKKNIEAKEKKQFSLQEGILKLMKKNTKITEEHKIGWDQIFSKKGLITGLLILAAPVLLKLANKLLSWLGNGGANVLSAAGKTIKDLATNADDYWTSDKRTDTERENWTESKIKTGLRLPKLAFDIAGRISKKSSKFLDEHPILKKIFGKKTTEETATKNSDNILSKVVKNIKNKLNIGDSSKMTDDVSSAMLDGAVDAMDDATVKSNTESTNIFSKIIKKITGSSTDDALEATAKSTIKNAAASSEAAVSTAKSAASSANKKAYDSLIDGFKKGIEYICENAKRLNFKKIPADKISAEATEKLIKTTGKEALEKGSVKVMEKLATAATGMAIIADVSFVTYDVIKAYSTDRACELFLVNPEDVDLIMKTITALIDGALEVGWAFIIELIDDIVENVTEAKDGIGFSIRREVATLLYNAMHSEANDTAETLFSKVKRRINNSFNLSSDKSLDEAQSDYEKEWRQYLKDNNLTAEAYPLKKYISDNADTTFYKAGGSKIYDWLGGDRSIINGLIGGNSLSSYGATDVLTQAYDLINNTSAAVNNLNPISRLLNGKKDYSSTSADEIAAKAVTSAGRALSAANKVTSAATSTAGKVTSKISNALSKIRNKFNIGGEDTSNKSYSFNEIIEKAKHANDPDYGKFENGVGGSADNILSEYQKTSGYGYRDLDGDGQYTMHRGVDLDKGKNTPIPSFTNGKVVDVVNKYKPDSGSLRASGYGNYVMVKSDDGKYNLYGHLNGTNVSVGDNVNQGDQLGIEGHTGNSTGAHLHYEVRTSEDYGTDINPEDYLEAYTGVATNLKSSNSSGNNSSTITETEDYGLSKFSSGLSDMLTLMASPIQGFSESLSGILGLATNNSVEVTKEIPATSSETSDYSTVATNLEDELAAKTYELTKKREGNGYTKVTPNDYGKFGFGTMGYTGSNAGTLLTEMASKVGGTKGNRLAYFASRSGGTLSTSEANELESLLNDRSVNAVSKAVQDSHALNLIKGTNMTVPMQMLKQSEILDPRSVPLIADITNTSPASTNYWREVYKPASSKDTDLSNVLRSLTSTDSWWGRTKNNSKYAGVYKGYMNRLNSDYNELKDWNPVYGGEDMSGVSIPKELIEKALSKESSNIDKFVDAETNKSNMGGDIFGKVLSKTLDKKILNNNVRVGGENVNDLSSISTLIDKVITILTEISTNTEASSDKLDELEAISTTITSLTESNTSNSSTNSKKSSRTAATKQTTQRNSTNYKLAKAVASGGY